MDAELKAYLQQLSQQVADTRQDMGAMREDLVRRMVESDAETRKELTDRMVSLNAQAIEHAEQLHTEARVLIEAVRDEVRLVADGVETVNEKLDRITPDHERRIQALERKAL